MPGHLLVDTHFSGGGLEWARSAIHRRNSPSAPATIIPNNLAAESGNPQSNFWLSGHMPADWLEV
jgi:hypothetical protein